MFRGFIINSLISLACLHLIASDASARQPGNNREGVSNVSERYEKGPREPKFPPPDEVEKIRNGTQSPTYPRVRIYAGGGLRKMQNTALEKSFDLTEEALGVSTSTRSRRFSDNATTMNIGIRLALVRQLSVWLQFQGSAGLTENSKISSEREGLETQAMSVSFLYTYHFRPGNSPSLSLGAGFVSQKLGANRKYGIRLADSDGTLKYIRVNVEPQSAGLLVGLFEVPFSRTANTGLYFSGQVVVGGTSEDEEIGRISVNAAGVPLKVGMTGYWLTVGLSHGI